MGSHFTREALSRGWNVRGIDKQTYASRTDHLTEFFENEKFHFDAQDISKLDHLPDVDVVVNFAAETHVDNSIIDSKHFLQSNVLGVQNLLELIRAKRNYEMPLFLQISTDEVYGDILKGKHTEKDGLNPSNPYSASKASADMLVLGWHRTYDVPYLIVRPTNNYGTDQYPEKLIPKAVRCLLSEKPIPLHGKGLYRRSWLHVEDTCSALFHLIDSRERNRVFNVSGTYEATNSDVIRKVIGSFFGKKLSMVPYVKFNYVRMGQDIRYSLDDSELRRTGWTPQKQFNAEIPAIVEHLKRRV